MPEIFWTKMTSKSLGSLVFLFPCAISPLYSLLLTGHKAKMAPDLLVENHLADRHFIDAG
jgi:hypothetical protein